VKPHRCYFAHHGKPPCGPVEFWWLLRPVPFRRLAEWVALCARCCMVMRKHEVEAEAITNTEPQNVAIYYADDIVVHISRQEQR
jgi:hypothetical protein